MSPTLTNGKGLSVSSSSGRFDGARRVMPACRILSQVPVFTLGRLPAEANNSTPPPPPPKSSFFSRLEHAVGVMRWSVTAHFSTHSLATTTDGVALDLTDSGGGTILLADFAMANLDATDFNCLMGFQRFQGRQTVLFTKVN